MILSVASGKGGTGKTTVAVNLAVALSPGVQLLDCDVEQPNAHIFIHPSDEKTETIATLVPQVDEAQCNLCGKCEELCQFKAIVLIGDTIMTFEELCHSCGGCMAVCPQGAVTEKHRPLGVVHKGRCNGLELVTGRLRVGEAMAPPLIKAVRSLAAPDQITIIDAPPGTSCPVIASIRDTDFVILVTEPTPFGLHDLKLAVEVVRVLDIPCGLIINRADIGNDQVRAYAHEQGLPLLMEIPFERRIAEAYSRGDLMVDVMPEFKKKFHQVYQHIQQIVNLRRAC